MEKSKTNLFLVRHGRTDWNALGRFQGRIERPLDEVGIEQAEEVARRLADLEIDAIYSSDMLRARQTADIIAKHHDLPIVFVPDLKEGSYGPIDGIMKEEFHIRFAEVLKVRNALPSKEKFHHRLVEGAETSAEILARALPCLQTISKNHPGQQIIVVTHGWVMRSLFVFFSEFEVDFVNVENGAVLHLHGEGEVLTIAAHEGITKTLS